MAESIYRKASLAMIPYGAKEDELPSIKPTDGSGDFTFSRGSDIQATRVNSSGLIEKAKENLLLQSNSFNTNWGVSNLSRTSGQSGYDGSSDAWLINKTASSGYLYQNNSTSGVQTFSVYAKAGSVNWIRMTSIGSSDCHQFFDLQNGLVGTPSGGSFIDSSIEAVGATGWYRCSVTHNQSLAQPRIYPAESDGVYSGTSGSVYIQDSQINHGLIAQDYVETTTTAVVEGLTADLPRLDYSGGASCPSLLLEPSRTNISVHSEFFGGWTTIGTATFTANYSASPEGVQNAYRFEATSAARGGKFIPISVSSGTTYTLSFYAKSLSGTQKIRIGADNGCSTPQDAETFEIGTEWLRIDKTITSDQTSWNLFFDNVESGTACTGTYLDVDMLVYGFQCEAGSYPTSYIPTYGTAANRGGDVCIDGGDSSTFNDSEGVLYAEISALANDSTNRIISVSDGSGSNRLLIKYDNSSNLIEASLTDGGVDQAVLTHTYTIINNAKIAFKYKANDFALWVNGTEVDTDSSGTIPSGLDTLNLDNGSGGSAFYGNAKQILYFPTALIDTELAALTTI